MPPPKYTQVPPPGKIDIVYFFLGVSFILSYMQAGFLKIKPECKAGRADLPVSEANISAYKISFPQEVI